MKQFRARDAFCAEHQQIPSLGDLSLSALLQTLIGQHVGPETEALSRLTCPICGLKYMEFRKEGRLGCPSDYAAFKAGLLPILRRVHRSIRHVGKVPHKRRPSGPAAELLDLRQRLRRAVQTEAFEEAARLRDMIRDKEAAHEPG